jgi:hypothetical protein
MVQVAGHSELVTGVRFSPDGRRLVSVGGDGCIFVWRLPPEMTQVMLLSFADIDAQTWYATPSHLVCIISGDRQNLLLALRQSQSACKAGAKPPPPNDHTGHSKPDLVAPRRDWSSFEGRSGATSSLVRNTESSCLSPLPGHARPSCGAPRVGDPARGAGPRHDPPGCQPLQDHATHHRSRQHAGGWLGGKVENDGARKPRSRRWVRGWSTLLP